MNINISGEVVRTSQLPKRIIGLGDYLVALNSSPLETSTVLVSDFVSFLNTQFATSLASLTDVSINGPLPGQALVFNGSYWVNQGIGELDTLDSVTTRGNTTLNSITTGGLYSPYLRLDTVATPTLQAGMFAWNDVDGTANLRLKGNNVTLQIGQETVARVVNKTGADLLESEYKVVRVRVASEGGAQGQRLAVVLAQGDNDPDSATTLGVVTENIGNNQEGFITIFGNVNGINTTGSLQGETWVDGDVLYLSPTTPGGLTKVKPQAPQHTLIVGYVVYAHQNNGKIFVKVDNGYELDELHNVLISNPNNNDILQYNSTQQVWKNIAASVAVPTPTLDQVTTAGNTTTNSITVGGLTVATNLIYTDTVNGRVGIGTSSPSSKFHVNIASSADFMLGTSSTLPAIIYPSGGYMIRWKNDGSEVYMGSSSWTVLKTQTNEVIVRPTFTYIPNYNVGIGTTTDAGYKLDVNGTTRVTSLYTANIYPVSSTVSIWVNSQNSGSRFYFSPVHPDGRINFNAVAGTNDYTLLRAWHTGNTIGLGTGSSAGGGALTTYSDSVLIGTSGAIYFMAGTFGPNNVPYRLGITTNATTTSFSSGVANNITNIESHAFAFTAKSHTFYTGTTAGNQGNPNQYTPLHLSTGGNVVVGGTTDAGYKLDINGTFRTLVGTETNPFRLEHTNGNYMTMIVGAGSALAAGQFGMYFNGSPMWSWNGAVFRLHGNTISTASNPSTLVVQGGYGGSTVGTSIRLSSNTPNQGQWTATTGAQVTVEVGNHSNETWAPSSGNASYTILSVAPKINTSGTYTGIVRGFYYNPTLTSLTGTTHRGMEITSGDFIWGNGYSQYYGDSIEGFVQFQSSGNSTKIWIRPSGSQGAFNNNYWGYLENSGYTTTLKAGQYHDLSLAADTIRFKNQYLTELARFAATSGNLLINTTTDAGYKVDVNGTVRVVSGITATSNGHRFGNLEVLTSGVAGGTGQGIVVSGVDTTFQFHGSGAPADMFQFRNWAGTTTTTTITGTDKNVIRIYGGYQTGNINGLAGNILTLTPTYNFTGATTHIVRGLYYNPTLTSLTNATHRAIETTSGDVIFNGGNVGIGTSTPSYKLEVTGNAYFNEKVLIGNGEALSLWTNFAQIKPPVINTLGFYTGTSSADERMRITTTGNILINTTTDNGYKLQVNGGGAFVKGSGTTSSTNTLLIENSSGTQLFKLSDDGTINTSYSAPLNCNFLLNVTYDITCRGIYGNSGALSLTGASAGNATGTMVNVSYYGSPAGGNIGTSLKISSATLQSAVHIGLNFNGDYTTSVGSNTLIGYNFAPTNYGTATLRAFQSAIGGVYVNTTSYQASAVLQADSTTQGFLAPRMTTAQILLITSPAEGLQVYNTDLHTICFFDGTIWQRVTSTAM